jgi:hypothetical protein
MCRFGNLLELLLGLRTDAALLARLEFSGKPFKFRFHFTYFGSNIIAQSLCHRAEGLFRLIFGALRFKGEEGFLRPVENDTG